MVHAHPAGMAQHGREHLAPRCIARGGQALRVPWWLRPILALLVIVIRRGAYRALRRQILCEVYGIGAARVHTHGKVSHQAQAHAGIECALLRGGQLLIAQELQPGIKARELVHVQAFGMALARLRGGVLLRAPIREIAQATALLAGVAHEGLFALRGGLVVKELAQHLQFGLKNGVALYFFCAAVALAKLLRQLAHIIL